MELEIYPNPTENGRISIDVNQAGNYELVDLNGSQLQKGEIYLGTNLLDFSVLSSGVYILHLQLSRQLVTRQIQLF